MKIDFDCKTKGLEASAKSPEPAPARPAALQPGAAARMLGSVLVHMMVAVVVYTVWRFANLWDIGKFQLHFLLSAAGYQLLMVEAVLTFNGDYSMSHLLSRDHKRKVHFALMVAGGLCSVAGTCIALVEFGGKFKSIHGICGLIALIFSILSMCSGAVTFFSASLKHLVRPALVKFLHIGCGVVALILGLATLTLGVNKPFFIASNGRGVTNCMTTFIVFILLYTLITPMVNFKRIGSNLTSSV